MRNNLEEFLKDNTRNKEIFEDNMRNKYVVYKEEYNQRFDNIYYKRYYDGLSSNEYSFGGYYDKKEHTLYDPSWNVRNMFMADNKIQISNLSDIDKAIENKLSEKVNIFLQDNKTKLKQYGKTMFEYLTENDIKRINGEVNQEYITQLNPQVSLTYKLGTYDIRGLKNYNSGDVYMKYLYDSDDLIDLLFNEVKELKKEEIGFSALIYDYKTKYLEKLFKNNEPVYNQVNLNRNIYQSLKDIYAKTVNINITYGENNMTFKYDIDDLRRSLARGDSCTGTYTSAYKKVIEFIKNNDTVREYKNDFEFSHINFITHGKEELYNKKNFEKVLKQNKKHERDDR